MENAINNENLEEISSEIPADSIQISVEQICAAIISTFGSVEIELPVLVADYSGKNISINQDENSKSLTFSLVDAPVDTLVEE